MEAPAIKVKIPATAAKGEIVEIKTAITHDMESGQRKDKSGQPIPRSIINRFSCRVNGHEVFAADWHPAVSANPYLSFFIRAEESASIELNWADDSGKVYTHTAALMVK